MAITIDAGNMHYRDLNIAIKKSLEQEREIILVNVNGQRYIGDGLKGEYKLVIDGVPGNDLGIFMDGCEVVVNGNVQDEAANTMNSGTIIVHGSAGDTLGYAMRGGEVFIRDNAGYRAGIHMKEYQHNKPVIVIGGTAGDFLGEYMAGGLIIVLNLSKEQNAVGNYCASGMHGGVIFIREQNSICLPEGVYKVPLDHTDVDILDYYLKSYQQHFNKTVPEVRRDEFIKITTANVRPYKHLYVGI